MLVKAQLELEVCIIQGSISRSSTYLKVCPCSGYCTGRATDAATEVLDLDCVRVRFAAYDRRHKSLFLSLVECFQ